MIKEESSEAQDLAAIAKRLNEVASELLSITLDLQSRALGRLADDSGIGSSAEKKSQDRASSETQDYWDPDGDIGGLAAPLQDDETGTDPPGGTGGYR